MDVYKNICAHQKFRGIKSMPTGKVKWFNNAKGYGFILPGEEGNGEDLFVHYSSINMDGYRTLKAGQLVNYEILQGPKGLHAININALTEEEIEVFNDLHESNETKNIEETRLSEPVSEEKAVLQDL